MRAIKILTSNSPVHCNEYPIATDTDISIGAAVVLTAGKVVLAAAGQTTAILGIAAENHGGTADALNPRANGTKIMVIDNPAVLLEQKAPEATATGGSTTTITMAYYSGANDDFNNGKAKLISKVAGSTNTDPIGTVYDITDSSYLSNVQTLTISTAGGAVTSGDKFLIFPPIAVAIKALLNATMTEIVWVSSTTAVAALPFKCFGHDYDRNTISFIPTLATFANED